MIIQICELVGLYALWHWFRPYTDNQEENDKIREALNSYRGVKRRFEYHVNKPDIVYIDDYAHHPEELKFAIQSAKELYPTKKTNYEILY